MSGPYREPGEVPFRWVADEAEMVNIVREFFPMGPCYILGGYVVYAPEADLSRASMQDGYCLSLNVPYVSGDSEKYLRTWRYLPPVGSPRKLRSAVLLAKAEMEDEIWAYLRADWCCNSRTMY